MGWAQGPTAMGPAAERVGVALSPDKALPQTLDLDLFVPAKSEGKTVVLPIPFTNFWPGLSPLPYRITGLGLECSHSLTESLLLG